MHLMHHTIKPIKRSRINIVKSIIKHIKMRLLCAHFSSPSLYVLWNFYHNFHCFIAFSRRFLPWSQAFVDSRQNQLFVSDLCFLARLSLHTKFVDSLSRIENKSCVSIQRVLNRALLKSNIFLLQKCSRASEELVEAIIAALSVLRNNAYEKLQRKCFMFHSTLDKTLDLVTRFPQKQNTQWCGYFIGIINILSIVSLAVFSSFY